MNHSSEAILRNLERAVRACDRAVRSGTASEIQIARDLIVWLARELVAENVKENATRHRPEPTP